MKKLLYTSLIIIAAFFLLNTQLTHAQMGSMMRADDVGNEIEAEESGYGESINKVLSDILTKQQISTVQELDCDQVSDDDLERLGDAVMEQQHPGKAHEAMDQMLGGEGSESLKQMHINMGNAYLGCGGNFGPGMMGGGMMGMMGNRNGSTNNNYPQRGFSMMGFGGGMFGGYSLLGSLTWIALIAFLLAGVYFFLKQANKK